MRATRLAAAVSVAMGAALVAPALLAAQAEGRAPRVLEVPASTRAMALGGAYAMSSGHADALFYHPALLTGAEGLGLELQRWGDAGSGATASAAFSWLGGGVGLGLQVLQYEAPAEGLDALPGGQDVLFERASAPISERVASIGYARSLLGVRVGAVGKLLEQRDGTDRDAGAVADVGVAADVGPLVLGLSARNLGAGLDLGADAPRLPRTFAVGLGGYGQPLGPLDLGFAAELARRDDGTVLAGGGVEVGYWPVNGRNFVGRIGLQRVPEGEGSPLTLGFAFWGDDLVLEWAYRDYGALDEGTHRFGVRWR